MSKQIDYKKRIHFRIRKKVKGTAERPRVVVYRSLKHIYLQAIDDIKGNTLASISTIEKELQGEIKKGKKKIEISKIIGKRFGDRLKEKNIGAVVFDRAGFRYHGRIQAAADGMREAGIKF